MSLKPQNIVQAAEADLKREARNIRRASLLAVGQTDGTGYEEYAFHRKHVRKAVMPSSLIVMALMDPTPGLESHKDNTRLIYGDAQLLIAAIRIA